MAWTGLLLAAALATATADAAPEAPDHRQQLARQYWTGLADRIVRDGTPRDRALLSQFPYHGADGLTGSAREGRQLRIASERAPTDELVQWLWASASPAASGCSASDPCPDRAMASARLTPDNARAWLPVLEAAQAAGDREATSAVLGRMASASHFSEPFAPVVDAWRDLLRRAPLPEAALFDEAGQPEHGPEARRYRDAVAGVAAAAAMAMPIQGLYRHCDVKATPAPSATDIGRCRQVARLMLRAPTLIQRSLGEALMRRAGGEPVDWKRQQLWWLSAQFALDRDHAEAMRYFDDLHDTQSEIRAIELALQRAGKPLTPPADWVYVSPFAPSADAGAATTEPARPATP